MNSKDHLMIGVKLILLTHTLITMIIHRELYLVVKVKWLEF